jgi:nucleotide-binding universal stress UspA family protein
MAAAFQARMVIVSVAPVEAAAISGIPLGVDYTPPDPSVEEELRRILEEAVEKMETKAEARGVECETRVVTASPVDGILSAAEDVGADLIVVGHHERGFLERLLEGSVSGSVARHAHCDVLIVHSPHEKSD